MAVYPVLQLARDLECRELWHVSKRRFRQLPIVLGRNCSYFAETSIRRGGDLRHDMPPPGLFLGVSESILKTRMPST